MEVWIGIWKKILVWNGIFLVWNGNEMEENWQYGVWKNRLPFHFIPCPGCNLGQYVETRRIFNVQFFFQFLVFTKLYYVRVILFVMLSLKVGGMFAGSSEGEPKIT